MFSLLYAGPAAAKMTALAKSLQRTQETDAAEYRAMQELLAPEQFATWLVERNRLREEARKEAIAERRHQELCSAIRASRSTSTFWFWF